MKTKHPNKDGLHVKPVVRQKIDTQARNEKLREVYANRILEEWRANVQLYIHHDNLKQERIRHFLTMQGALLAFVGLATKQAIEGWQTLLTPITFLLFSIGISIIGLFLALAWKGMDDRARKFTLFERRCLRDLENQWNTLLPGDSSGLSTYTALGIILEGGSESFQHIAPEYRKKIIEAYCGDYEILRSQTGPASARETHVFKAILYFWTSSTVGHIALLVTFLLLRHF